MPRKRVPPNPDFPYHVTARCINREWFRIELPEVWSLMTDYLYLTSHLFSLEIQSFVLMSNHFHLVVRTPQANLSTAMNYFMRETSREITRKSGRINQTYGSRFHRSLITSHHYYMNVYKYVYRNPVRAGLCARVEDYPFSTLHGLLGQRKMLIPMVEDTLLFNPSLDERHMKWLNTKSLSSHEEEIRKGLKRAVFSLVAGKNSGRPSELETRLI